MIKLKNLLIERIDYHELATQLVNSYNLKSKVKIGTGKTFGEYVPEKDLIHSCLYIAQSTFLTFHLGGWPMLFKCGIKSQVACTGK